MNPNKETRGRGPRDKDLDFKILAYLTEHPGAERAEIAKELRKKPTTVNAHAGEINK